MPTLSDAERAGYNTSAPPGWHPKAERLMRIDFLPGGNVPLIARRPRGVRTAAAERAEYYAELAAA